VTTGALVDPIERNHDVTEQYEQAYEPFEDRDFENALVFLPNPYGDWLNHPFQSLRNDPGFDGDAVYALADRQFDVTDAFPNRTYYRYVYRGEWVPYSRQSVTPRLQRVHEVAGPNVTTDLSLGVPPAAETIEVRGSFGPDGDSTAASMPQDGIDATITVADGEATVRSPQFVENLTVQRHGDQPFKRVTYVDYGALGGFEYVLTLPVDRIREGYRVLSPRLEVCRSPKRCDGEAAYIPGQHRTGIHMNASVSGGNS
jgi:hypothetical protein